MPESKLPYLNAYGNIKKALDKIKQAETPDRFTQDFLESTFAMKGGSSRPIIPFLKRTGFLGADGAPTELYRRFRNPDLTGGAAAEALRNGYAPLFGMDERVYKHETSKLKNLVVQATGFDADSGAARNIVKSFEALNDFAKFSELPEPSKLGESGPGGDDEPPAPLEPPNGDGGDSGDGGTGRFRLGYTINLNLPATSDVGVYNAIFRSLRDNLLRDLE